MKRKSVFVWVMLGIFGVAVSRGDVVTVTFANFTGLAMRLDSVATNGQKWVFPAGESVALVENASYVIRNVDADAGTAVDLSGLGGDGVGLQVHLEPAGVYGVAVVSRDRPLGWAIAGMGFGVTVFLGGYVRRQVTKQLTSGLSE